MIYRNSVVSPNGFLYNVVLDEPAANATFLHANEGVIGIKNGAISYVYGPDTVANSNYSWLSGLGYGSVSASSFKSVAFSCTGGTVVATIGGVATTSPIKAVVGTTIVFTITPDPGYSYSGTNPETVVVSADVTKSFVCEAIPYLCFTSTGATTVDLNSSMIAKKDGVDDSESNIGWQWSYDRSSWHTLDSTEVSLTDGQSMYVRGNGAPGGQYTFEVGGEGTVVLSGDLTSMLNGVGGVTDLTPYDELAIGPLFQYCNKITSAANLVLPSTILTGECYYSMFDSCSNLVSAPNLPAETLVTSCYNYMFNSCEKLAGTINIAATSPGEGEGNCVDMFADAGTAEGAGGTINVGGGTSAEWASAASIDTSHWTIVAPPNYLKFTATGASTIKFDRVYGDELEDEINEEVNADGWYIYYSLDNGATWIEEAASWGFVPTISVADGASILYRGNMTAGATGVNLIRFVMTGSFTVSGDITTLLNQVGGVLDLTPYPNSCLASTFKNCTALTSIDGLVFPSTTLTQTCYENMFYGCTGLTSVSVDLPATTLGANSCRNFFQNCYNLTGTINIAATSPYYSGTSSAFTGLVRNAGRDSAGGTIYVGGSDVATWQSAFLNFNPDKWTINVINAESDE